MPRSKATSFLTSDELRAWRDNLNLTQAEAAYLLGISSRQYSNLENAQSPIAKSFKLSCALINIACQDGHKGFAKVKEMLDEVLDIYFNRDE
jgi:transcriptional regulator with XRE-family HTH domain